MLCKRSIEKGIRKGYIITRGSIRDKKNTKKKQRTIAKGEKQNIHFHASSRPVEGILKYAPLRVCTLILRLLDSASV